MHGNEIPKQGQITAKVPTPMLSEVDQTTVTNLSESLIYDPSGYYYVLISISFAMEIFGHCELIKLNLTYVFLSAYIEIRAFIASFYCIFQINDLDRLTRNNSPDV